jgi:uncharacterized protein (TIGR03437 family)
VTTTFYTSGTHNINVSYAGDSYFLASADQLKQFVNRLTTSMTLTSSTAASSFGAPVTFTVQLGPVGPSGVSGPGNLVQFYDGNTPMGSVTPSSYVATLTTTSLSGGPHQITATYTGDGSWDSARCPTVSVTISDATSATILSASTNLPRVTLSATVTGLPGTTAFPTGSVNFVDLVSKQILGTANLPFGAVGASITLDATQLSANAGHGLAAVFSGDANYTPSTSNILSVPAVINAAGGTSTVFAPNELASLFGSSLASATLQTSNVPLPGLLGGDSLSVIDSAGVERPAGLYMVSPTQVNFVLPDNTAPGPAWVTLTSASGIAIPAQVKVGTVAPGLFSADGTGKGLAAAQIIRVSSDGTQTTQYLSGSISMGTDKIYLVMYGTGIRGRTSLASVTATINGENLSVLYAGPQPQYPGLDQVNLLLPANLQGAGTVNITVTVDGQSSNVVSMTFQ